MFRCWDFDFYPRVPCKPLRLNSTLEAPVRLAKSRMSCLASDMGHGSPSGGWKPAIPCNQVVNTEPEASLCSLMWRPKRPPKGPWQLLRSNFCQVEYIHVYPWVDIHTSEDLAPWDPECCSTLSSWPFRIYPALYLVIFSKLSSSQEMKINKKSGFKSAGGSLANQQIRSN